MERSFVAAEVRTRGKVGEAIEGGELSTGRPCESITPLEGAVKGRANQGNEMGDQNYVVVASVEKKYLPKKK